MTDRYVTIAGDTIDGVLHRELLSNDDGTESEFWALNPDAALKTYDGLHFPAGVVLLLPTVALESAQEVSPWD